MINRLLYSLLFCAALSLFVGCGNKGIPCPSPTGKSMKVQAKGAAGLEAIKVPTDKNGRVQKRKKKFLLF
ncbi:hypothetical protein H7F15_18890 [Pontibacter sp. Tf4]|uniref:hypothetical protein n=1 Tax=Pontibacter sp. Tf4 TaxID=2761620 RepID=UPI001626448B|nr:hypothetical protein [Pontibacter sp. Tf4]MBB6613114.1 hypothetical protein [Pontibacter sp. Tf4]